MKKSFITSGPGVKSSFIMHLLQNSPDNRGMIQLCDIICRTALARMLSVDAYRSDP